MIKRILFLIICCTFSHLGLAQVDVTRDELPNTNSADSTEVLNNVLRQNQNAINSIGGYFNASGYLSPANGGTGTNITTFPNGSLLIYDAGNVGIGTFGQGTAGQTIISNGTGTSPSWGSANNTQIFTTSGTWTAPSGENAIFLTLCGGGGGGQSGTASGSLGGAAGAGAGCINHMLLAITPNTTYTFTIGNGGIGGVGTTGIQGADGVNSTFIGDSFTITAGRGRGSANSSTFGTVTFSTGNNISGALTNGQAAVAPSNPVGGSGGYSVVGLGGFPGSGAGINGGNGFLGGGGGGGYGTGAGAATNGGNGGNGIAIFQY